MGNRIITIRSLIPARLWRHCPGRQNPADIPSRGATASDLLRNPLWLNGPEWLKIPQGPLESIDADADTAIPEERGHVAHALTVNQADGPRVGKLINCEDYSSLHRLLRVTAIVLRFIRFLCLKAQGTREGEPLVPYWMTSTKLESTGSRNPKFPYLRAENSLCGNAS